MRIPWRIIIVVAAIYISYIIVGSSILTDSQNTGWDESTGEGGSSLFLAILIAFIGPFLAPIIAIVAAFIANKSLEPPFSAPAVIVFALVTILVIQGTVYASYLVTGQLTKSAIPPQSEVTQTISKAINSGDVKACNSLPTFKQLRYKEDLNRASGNAVAAEFGFFVLYVSRFEFPRFKYTGLYREQCYTEFATAQGDSEACAKISTGFLKDQCYQEVMQKNTDFEMCRKMNDKYLKKACYDYIIKVPCEKTSNESLKKACYREWIQKIMYPELCEEMPDQYLKDVCYREVIQNVTDPELCEEMPGENEKVPCYRELALKLGKPELCEKTNKDKCYWGLAIQLRKKELCEKVTDISYNHMCYYDIARMT